MLGGAVVTVDVQVPICALRDHGHGEVIEVTFSLRVLALLEVLLSTGPVGVRRDGEHNRRVTLHRVPPSGRRLQTSNKSIGKWLDVSKVRREADHGFPQGVNSQLAAGSLAVGVGVARASLNT